MKNIFITGANRGLGLMLVKKFLGQGDQVFATVRSIEKLGELNELKSQYKNQLNCFELNLDNPDSIKKLKTSIKSIAHIDLLINNAGYFSKADLLPLNEHQPSEILYTFQVNALGPLEVTTLLLPLLEKSKSPAVAHISSLMGSIADNTTGAYYAYRMSKAALNMFHKSFSVDFPHIKSIVLHPGWVQTDMGGKNADLTIDQSVSGLMKVLGELPQMKTGMFVDYSGKFLNW